MYYDLWRKVIRFESLSWIWIDRHGDIWAATDRKAQRVHKFRRNITILGILSIETLFLAAIENCLGSKVSVQKPRKKSLRSKKCARWSKNTHDGSRFYNERSQCEMWVNTFIYESPKMKDLMSKPCVSGFDPTIPLGEKFGKQLAVLCAVIFFCKNTSKTIVATFESIPHNTHQTSTSLWAAHK